MHKSLKVFSSSLLGLAAMFATAAPALAVEIVLLRSGNGIVGGPDASITYVGTGTCNSEFPTFTAADFAAAAGGPPATIVGQAHPLWSATLSCDAAANWVGTQPGAIPETALFAQGFRITTACIFRATLEFCWIVDDVLGGTNANPDGVYLNNFGVAGTSGGNYATATVAGPIDVTALVGTGQNYLYAYDVDGGCAVSGVNYSAVLRIEECPTPVTPSTWSGIKSRFE